MKKKLPLIGFAGKAGVGKDTAAAYLTAQYGFDRYAFASPIKRMLAVLGLPEEAFADHAAKEAIIPAYGRSYRHMAQTLGTEWGRSVHPDFWLLQAQMRYASLQRQDDSYGFAISDVRFENEAEWIRSEGGRVVHITGRETTVSGDAAKHVSESGVKMDYLRDCFVRNTGDIAYLGLQLDTIVRQELNRD